MMNGKKYLYTLIFIISAILLINSIWPSAFLSKFKKEVFQNFKDNSEAYIKTIENQWFYVEIDPDISHK